MLPFLLLADRLQLRERLAILRAAGRTLRANERVQSEAAAMDPEEVEDNGVGQQIVVSSAARNFAEQIDQSEFSGQREIQSKFDGSPVPSEGRPGGAPRGYGERSAIAATTPHRGPASLAEIPERWPQRRQPR